MKRRREENMYPAVKRYFRGELGCEHISVDLPDEKKVHLPRNLSKRDPDVLGITDDNEVAVAEGKILNRTGQPFEQCVQQTESLKSFADYLYVFFPKEDWGALSKDDADRNRRILRDKNIGLILVDEKGRAKVLAKPPSNDAVEDSKRDQVRKLMGLASDDSVPAMTGIDAESARRLNAMLACCETVLQEIIQGAIAHVFRKTKAKGSYDVYSSDDEGDSQKLRVFRWAVWPKDAIIEIDVFGGYLGDGKPCIWISKDVSAEFLCDHLTNRRIPFGTHVQFYEEDDIVPCPDVTESRINASAEADANFCLCHKVELWKRSRTGLQKEIESLLQQTRKLR